jgi:RNA polymerase sigma factor (sigma-70 family)
MSEEMKPMRVVIVGGGFAAVQFAKNLRRKLDASKCEILLFNRENHMVFHPLLADVAGASINADAAAAPLRQMLPRVECRTERVQRIDVANSEIEFDDASGALTRLHYDHVVIACGAESNLGIIPGMTEHAFAFKVMRDALDLRQHVVRQMENAEASSDPDRRHRYLSFIIVRAGFSGVEVAGEINELVRSSTRFYRNFRKEDVTVTLVHSQNQILPEVAPKLREFAQKKMQQAGITMLLNTRAVAIDNNFSTREPVKSARCRSKMLVQTRPQGHKWEAVQEIFLTSRPRFVRLAYSILRNKEDAEDAVQDALLSAYSHLHTFEGRSALTTWFTRIVLNAALVIRRKRKNSRISSFPESCTAEDTPWTETVPASEPDPEMLYAEEETLQLVDVLLEKMSPILRQAFTTTYYDEMSNREACALLGITTRTFKSRLRRARQYVVNRAQPALAVPTRRVTLSPFSHDKNSLQTFAPSPAEISPLEIAFS